MSWLRPGGWLPGWRSSLAGVLAALMAVPPGPLASASASGMVKGTVTADGRPLSGVGVALIEIESGAIYRARSDAAGSFHESLVPGQYVLTTENQAGLVVGRAPTLVSVKPGETASVGVELLALPSAVPADNTTPAPEPSGVPVTNTTIAPAATPPSQTAEWPTCFVAGEFPLIPASIEPKASVARARVYFKGARSQTYYYVEMTRALEGFLPDAFIGKLPRPRLEASPVIYYVQATTADFGEGQTLEISAIVVEKESECKDKPIAAFGPPGEVTVFSAATGLRIAPIGFAGGSLILTSGLLALLLGGAAAVGITTSIIVFNPAPEPTPSGTGTGGPTPAPGPVTPGPPEPLPAPEPATPIVP